MSSVKPPFAHPRPFRTARARVAVLAAIGLVLAVLTPVAGSAPSASAATSTVTLTTSDSTWTTTRTPTKTGVTSSYLSATYSQDRAYLKFNGASLQGKRVVSAKLVLRVVDTSATKPGIVVHPSSSSWRGSTLTHANRPTDNARSLNSTSPQARAGASVTVPLSDIRTISTTGSFSFRLQYSQPGTRAAYAKKGTDAPKLVLTVEAAAPAATATPTATPTSTPSSSPVGRPASGSGDKKVFAVYFPPYPLSLDNAPAASDYYARNYLTVDGEKGAHAAYGGLLRDRPIPVGASSSSTWKVDNLRKEIRQARAAGIDGFFVNVMSTSGLNWETTVNLFAASKLEGGYPIIPMVDGTTSISRQTPAQVAAKLAELYRGTTAYREGDRFLLSSFKAEGPGVGWWTEIIRLLQSQYKIPITFQAVFLATTDANMTAFAPIADSFGNWGARSASAIDGLPDFDAMAEKYGRAWMEPVAPQDMRPRLGVYAEAGNTEALRAGWAKAIRDDAKYVQMVTWNDYSESTQFAPSAAHGDVFTQISKYYSAWFHAGSAPAITRDELFLTHRIQFTGAAPSVAHRLVTPTLSGSAGAPRDTVEALVFLTAPGTVEVTAGGKTSTFSAPAGVAAFTVPLQIGSVRARVLRGGAAARTAVSPFAVVRTPKLQDLQYYAVRGE